MNDLDLVGGKDPFMVKAFRRAQNLKRVKRAAKMLFRNLHWVPLRLDVPDNVRFDECWGTNGFVDQAALIARTKFQGQDLTIRLAVGTLYGANDAPGGTVRVNNGAHCISYGVNASGDAFLLHADTLLLEDAYGLNQRTMGCIDREVERFTDPQTKECQNARLMRDFFLHVDDTFRIFRIEPKS